MLYFLIIIFTLGCVANPGNVTQEIYEIKDYQVLADAIVLEKGGIDWGSELTQDTVNGGMEVPFEPKYDVFDSEPIMEEIYPEITDDVSQETIDKPVLNDGCGGVECKPQYVCEKYDSGKATCIFAAECSNKGVVKISGEFEKIPSGTYVKVEALLTIGSPMCTTLACAEGNLCCNSCFAQLLVGNLDSPYVLVGNGFDIGCVGNECTYSNQCIPFQPGKYYWIWGVVDVSGPVKRIIVDGGCLVGQGFEK